MEKEFCFKNKKFECLDPSKPYYKNDQFETYIVLRKGKKYFLDVVHYEFNDLMFLVKKIKQFKIPSPRILKIDKQKKLILKEFIDGNKAEEIIAKESFKDEYFKSLFYIYKIARANKINISYLPEDFLIKKENLFYLNYEIKKKNDENDFEKGPIRLWLLTNEGKAHLKALGFDVSMAKNEDEKYWNKKILLLSIQYW